MSKKVILVTGASSGIGKATAEQLIAEGNIVYVAARRIDKMKDLQKKGGTSIKMDITSEEDVQKAVNTIIENEGRLDVLVNNAGYAIYGPVEEITIEEARRQFDVNIFGLARLTQLVIPHMRAQKSGTIINMSSMGGKMYTPLGAWYHATKHALEGWSDSLRLELKQFGIDVVIIEPGGIKTEFGDVMLDPLNKRSGEGPYKEMVHALIKGTEETYNNSKISPPSVIAKAVSEAVNARKPKTRYRRGYMAKPAVFIRTVLGDKVWDKMIMSMA